MDAKVDDGLPAPVPPVDPETAPFWEATRDGVLLLPWCGACAAVVWYPRGFCPRCGADEVTWTPASGRGTVYSFTVVRKASGEFAGAVPYVVACVELAEGPRVLTNLVGCDPVAVRIGAPVEIAWRPTADGTRLYRFRPV